MRKRGKKIFFQLQVSQVLATRLFYSSPASASRLASYFPSSSSTSPRASSLAVAAGAVDGLGPVGLGVSLSIVAALMPQEKLRKLCRDSPGTKYQFKNWKITRKNILQAF